MEFSKIGVLMAEDQTKPGCRYGHGDLLRVSIGAIKEWSILAAGTQSAFSMAMYICRTCGYLEFFDTDPGRTISQIDK